MVAPTPIQTLFLKKIGYRHSCRSNHNSLSTKESISPENKMFVGTGDGEIKVIHGNCHLSGIFPYLKTYAHGRMNGEYDFGSECGRSPD